MPPALLLASSFTCSGFRFSKSVHTSNVTCNNGQARLIVCQQQDKEKGGAKSNEEVARHEEAPCEKISRRAMTVGRATILKSSGAAVLLAFLGFGGERPDYLGVQKNPPSLALCPPAPTCISTSEELNDPAHYVPPWTYNPQDGRGRKNPASKEQAMVELIAAIKSTKPDNFTPRIIDQSDDYVYVEYSSPILGFIDDVEFWFPPGNRSLVEYRPCAKNWNIKVGSLSASNTDHVAIEDIASLPENSEGCVKLTVVPTDVTTGSVTCDWKLIGDGYDKDLHCLKQIL